MSELHLVTVLLLGEPVGRLRWLWTRCVCPCCQNTHQERARQMYVASLVKQRVLWSN